MILRRPRRAVRLALLAGAPLALLAGCGGGGGGGGGAPSPLPPPPPPPLTITTTSLPTGVVGAAYSVTLQATGGTGARTWSEPSGSFDDATGAGASGTACKGLTLDFAAGTISGTPMNSGVCGPFTVRVDDSAGQSDTQDLRITINAAPVSRNDSIADATPLSGCTPSCMVQASISPYADPVDFANPDNDFYQLTADVGVIVTVETTARRLFPSSSPLDSVIEIVDASGIRFTTCRNVGTDDGVTGAPDPTPNVFDDDCLNDDIELGVIRDSKLEFQVPGSSGSVTFFVRVLDWRGDARPDLIYDLTISGAN